MSFEHKLHHEECSEKLIGLSFDNNTFSSSQEDQIKQQSPRCPRCRLLHSFVCVSFDDSDTELSELFDSHGNLDETIEWDTFLVQAHSTKKLDWMCNWDHVL